MNTIDLTELCLVVIALLAAIITPRIVKLLQEKTTAAQRSNLMALAKIGVKAAEQMFGKSQTSEKKEYVRALLNESGFDVDIDEVENAIEAAVLEIHNALKESEENAL